MTVRDLVLAAGGAASYTPTYIEDVFSTYLYTGNGGNLLLENGLALNTQSEQLFEKPGTYTWICPTGVTSVSVVCIGGGAGGYDSGGWMQGGAGGGLGYKNNVSVTPGTAYTVIVGASGGSSEFKLSTTGLVGASGGSNSYTVGAPLYGSSGGSGGTGGGDTIGDYSGGGGGGGAGGYTGNGGPGRDYGGSNSVAGTGGGSGGGANFGGQGMGVYGPPANSSNYSGWHVGGSYGGGGGGDPNYSNNGGTGAVRIIWSGATRQFPSTLVAKGTTSNGGFSWLKNRSGASNHVLVADVPNLSEPFRPPAYLSTNNTAAYATSTTTVPFFTSNGLQVGSNALVNTSGNLYSSWSFKKQPKFVDVVQFNTSAEYNEFGELIAGGNATVPHGLQSTPGFIMIRRLAGGDWYCYHRDLGTTKYILMNSTAAEISIELFIAVTSTNFTVNGLGAWGDTFEGYVFAHNAGGFGLTGTDNVITCGSYTGSSGIKYVDLGFEPQWILRKTATAAGNWQIYDNMRQFASNSGSAPNATLFPNTSGAESASYGDGYIFPTATGFGDGNSSSANTYIYIAIRRGPMKVPTSGTSVFIPIASSAAAGTVLTTGFPIDMQIGRFRDVVNGDSSTVIDRLRGVSTNSTQSGQALITSATSAEAATTNKAWQWSNADFKVATDYGSTSSIYYNFKRAPSFFDEVCYTGTGNPITVNHNLGVTPELMIVRGRSGATGWVVYTAPTGATKYMRLDNTNAAATLTAVWNDTSPTSSVFTVGSNSSVNTVSATYVAYLFATCAGVSKVGSYTGTGASGNAITTGFAPRFLLIKCTSTTGNWIVFDTARGMGAGSEPYLLLNATGAETAGTDWLDVSSSGFSLNTTGNATNGSGQTYIYLAIA